MDVRPAAQREALEMKDEDAEEVKELLRRIYTQLKSIRYVAEQFATMRVYIDELLANVAAVGSGIQAGKRNSVSRK
jgi:hypothetical protein